MAARDSWIGWTDEERARKLQLIVNNSRFLILPWVRVRHFGEYYSLFVCAAAASGLRTPLRLSPATFGDARRRTVSRHQAANWTYLGKTRGRGRMDQHHKADGRAMKRIYVYRLCRDAQRRLTQDSAPRWLPRGKA